MKEQASRLTRRTKMNTIIRWTIAASILLAGVACYLLTAQNRNVEAQGTAGPGRILIKQGSILAYNKDGSNSFNLAYGDTFNYNFNWPSVSPQTGMIAFAAKGIGVTGYRVFVMNGDGSGFRQVTFPDGLAAPTQQTDMSPVISPDGTKIAFLSLRNNLYVKPGQYAQPELYVININGTGLRQVTSKQTQTDQYGNVSDTSVSSVAWSPNGSQFLIRGQRPNPKKPDRFGNNLGQLDEVLEKINVDGTGEQILTDGSPSHQVANYELAGLYLAVAMDWSPGGTILYTVGNGPGTYVAYNILGGGSLSDSQLGGLCATERCVRFSPDGGQLVFRGGGGKIKTANLDGTNQKIVADFSRNPDENSPVWWAPGPAIPTPDHLTLAPNPLVVYSGHSQTLTPTLFDAGGNVIFHAASAYNFTSGTGDCTACIKPTISQLPNGPTVTASDNSGIATLCASNAGLTGCTTVGNNFQSASVSATQPTTFTSGKSGPGAFTITRAGNTNSLIAVNFTLGGSAVRDVDYSLDVSGNGLTMAAGQSSVNINVRPTGKSASKGDKTVVLTLQPDPSNTFLVDGTANAATVTIKDDGLPPVTLSLSSIVPNKGGDGGGVTTTIYGQNIKPGATVKLSRSGQADIIGTAVSVAANGASLTTIFDLTGKAQGTWDVAVTNPNNTTATLSGAFTIEASRDAKVWADIVGRYTVRSNLTQTFYIAYGNSGNVDSAPTKFTVFIPAPMQVSGFPVLESIPGLGRGSLPNISIYDGGTMIEFFAPKVPANSSKYAPLQLTAPPGFVHQDVVLEIRILAAACPCLGTAGQPDPSVTLTPEVLSATDNYAKIVQHVRSASVNGDMTSEITIQDAQTPQEPTVNLTHLGTGIQWEIRATVPTSLLPPSLKGASSQNTQNTGTSETSTAASSTPYETMIFKGGAESIEVYLAARAAIEAREAIEKGVEFKELADCLAREGRISQATADDVKRVSDGRSAMRISAAVAESAGVLIKNPLVKLGNFAANQTLNVVDSYAIEKAPLNKLYKDICAEQIQTNDIAQECFNIQSTLTNSEDNEKARQAFLEKLTIECLKFEHLEEKARIYREYRRYKLNIVNSGDPNEKDGSQGAGPQQFISGTEPLRYAISFENVATATAPAQTVVVTDQLDSSKVDLSTFSLGAFSFNIYGAVPPPGLSSYTTDIDMRPAKNLIARISAQLDKNTGLLTWRFTSIDPATGQPTTDPLAGFLPPNKNAPEGQGSVAFSVMPKPNLSTGTEIRNKSRIVFDANTPIDTNEYLNTIDNSLPASHATPLDAVQSSIVFNVNWTGTDTGSGIQSYDVFVSENGGPFKFWQSNTTLTSGTFIGQPGRSYAFYTESRDGAGNLEPPKTTAEVITSAPSNITNAIDDTRFFVRQHYLDFLGREPDPPGFTTWVNGLNNCASGDTSCDRVHVSGIFYQSAEFQQRGYFVYRFYPVSFGRKPDYAEFTPDLASVSGFLTVAQLDAAKVAFISNFMARPAFVTKYNSLSNTAYVDTLLQTAGVTLSSRQSMIDGLNNAMLTRAAVLRQIVDSAEVSTKYFNQAFVVMEYFGYLRRDPDALYLNWIQVLDQTGDPRHMVEGFVNSTEYRHRFGP